MFMPCQSCLITGTDTGVGKTILTAAIVSYYAHYFPECRVAVYKPVQAGVGDREYYQQVLSLSQTLAEINPIYLATPLAPPLSADREGITIDLHHLWDSYEKLRQNYDLVLVESAGGLGSPITWAYTVADMAKDWRIPTLLVVPVVLGCISQSVVYSHFAQGRGIDLRGLVLNCSRPDSVLDDVAPIPLLEKLCHLPVLGTLPFIANCHDQQQLSAAAQALKFLPLSKLLA
jgi:dethiobiotin synthetase